jgi:hypothetical protein
VPHPLRFSAKDGFSTVVFVGRTFRCAIRKTARSGYLAPCLTRALSACLITRHSSLPLALDTIHHSIDDPLDYQQPRNRAQIHAASRASSYSSHSFDSDDHHRPRCFGFLALVCTTRQLLYGSMSLTPHRGHRELQQHDQTLAHSSPSSGHRQ